MRVVLAPMEGVMDPLMRQLLTELNPYDLCVTEFVRVVDLLLPEKVFYRLCPELKNDGKTLSGTPVRVQLLGQNPPVLAANAARAIELGSPGVDMNFGCPAKTVNRSKGGAVLLQEPELIYQIIKQMREAIPDEQILSAKIRLGWDDPSHVMEIADAVVQGGADELTIHARTKRDGYKADAIKWSAIKPVVDKISIPVIANGEIFSFEDGQRCQHASGCQDLMLGRGSLQIPNLADVVKNDAAPLTWDEMQPILYRYTQMEVKGDKEIYLPNRIKQWFGYLKKRYPEAIDQFEALRTLKTSAEITALYAAHAD
ncbi:tRNA dihydrouridine(16) synthase DusC [Ferrimonas pelagia]|uniref:tRNA-dihydrouridine(16) synthase n=1 Tax=Ferrimonas pelagia TaxID=1177826 RepID=A0ABP9F267_9GAMM